MLLGPVVRHALPQTPQLFGSLSRFTHAPPHMAPCEPGQAQTPSKHTRPGAQLFPQWPHWNASRERSTHPLPHAACPAAHVSRQAPAAQTWLAPHATAQLPQWLGSAVRSVQTPLHTAPRHDGGTDTSGASAVSASRVPAEAVEPEPSPCDASASLSCDVRPPQAEQMKTANRDALNKRKMASPDRTDAEGIHPLPSNCERKHITRGCGRYPPSRQFDTCAKVGSGFGRRSPSALRPFPLGLGRVDHAPWRVRLRRSQNARRTRGWFRISARAPRVARETAGGERER